MKTESLYLCALAFAPEEHRSSVPAYMYDLSERMGALPFDRFGVAPSPHYYKLSERSKFTFKGRDLTSYATLMERRAKELAAIDKPLYVYWSGGIDSTALMVALIREGVEMTVMMNDRSIWENGQFYYRFIKDKIKTRNSVDISVLNTLVEKDAHFITGELADQLFGSDTMQDVCLLEGWQLLHKPATEENVRRALLCKGMTDENIEPLYKVVFESAASQNVPIHRVFDFFWWISFAFKWQGVVYRMALYGPAELNSLLTEKHWDRVHHFFETDYFQTWSCTQHEYKILDRWNTYKFTSKQYIFEFDEHEDYMLNAVKIGSLRKFCDCANSSAIYAPLRVVTKAD